MRKIMPILAAVLVAFLCGCATTPTQNQTQQTIAVIKATVPMAVALAIERQPDSEPYLRAAAEAIELAAETNASPAALLAAIADIPGATNSPYVLPAILLGVTAWELYLSQNPDAMTTDNQAIARALADSIRAGLPERPVALMAKAVAPVASAPNFTIATTRAAAIRAALAERKAILTDFCSPICSDCGQMQSLMLRNAKVNALLAQKYVVWRVDVRKVPREWAPYVPFPLSMPVNVVIDPRRPDPSHVLGMRHGLCDGNSFALFLNNQWRRLPPFEP